MTCLGFLTMSGNIEVSQKKSLLMCYCLVLVEQLSELWAKTLQVSRDPRKIMKALRHSFMVRPSVLLLLVILSIENVS